MTIRRYLFTMYLRIARSDALPFSILGSLRVHISMSQGIFKTSKLQLLLHDLESIFRVLAPVIFFHRHQVALYNESVLLPDNSNWCEKGK
jgi:hypothetical protein